jgi:hypothetical protein
LALCLALLGVSITRAAVEGKIRPASEKDAATDENLEEAFARSTADAKAERAKWKGKSFEEFEKTVYREPFEGGKYIVSGDIAIPTREALQAFFRDYIQHDPTTTLIVHTVNGQDAVWSAADKQKISYCIDKGFGARHAAVVRDMEAASGAWEAVALVDFLYVPAEDASCTATNPKVVFDVRPVNEGQYLARAFFPNEGRPTRNVLIDESSFELDPAGKLQLVGILRHELGHTLGLRHEQTRPEAGTCFEDSNWRPLTAYDAFSVMHYPQCNGGGDWSLVLTDDDKHGVACLYGAARGAPLDTGTCPNAVPSAVSGAPAP